MAIAVRAPRSHTRSRVARGRRQRTAEDTAPVVLMIVALLVVGIVAIGLFSQTLDLTVPRELVSSYDRKPAARPADGAVPVSKVQLAAVPDAVTEDPTAASRDVEVGARARVAHTDGQGVVFYSAPRQNARMPAGLLEGTEVSVLELSDEFARVKADNKKAGWVRAAYLVSAE
jgi:uncharacterized protein (DUF58 family)